MAKQNIHLNYAPHENNIRNLWNFKFQDQLGELLKALEEKSMKIEEFVSDIESLFNSVEVSPVFFLTSSFPLQNCF